MKSMKVFHNGKRLKDIYPHATRFQVFKYKLARFIRKVVIASFIIGLAYGSFHVGKATTQSKVVQAEDRSEALLDSRIDKLKGEVVSQIQKCESKGHDEDDGIIIFDSNNKASIGTMQFQKSTVIHYYKSLYGKDITPKEAVLIALDDEKARALAKDIMFTSKRLADDWYNCAVKHNVNAQISIIKELK